MSNYFPHLISLHLPKLGLMSRLFLLAVPMIRMVLVLAWCVCAINNVINFV